MRIVMEPSEYTLLNIGDTAMLEVAFARLRALFPDATIEVFTDDAKRLVSYCPSAVPLNIRGREIWLRDGYLFAWLYRLLSKNGITVHLRELERSLRRRWPSFAALPIRLRAKLTSGDSEDVNAYLRSISKADLMVVSGMGGITDVFKDYALEVLDNLALAIRRGIPTAMFGQGIGPIQDPTLKARAKEVLPSVDLIALRERRAGGPLLELLGVPSNRVLITGDDAIEIAYRSRAGELGNALGINLRAACYSEVDHRFIEEMRPVIQKAATMRKVPIIPIPISQIPGEDDALTIERLMTGCHEMSDARERAVTRSQVLERIRGCRVVVTGSYHAGVFALAQGVPVVGLAKSDYYCDKFLGLADQFGTGCEVVLLKDSGWPIKFTTAIDRLWQLAEQMRFELLDAAAHQLELSRAAYQHFHRLMSSKLINAV
jgi:colanic acid/amylovoran biosynthesis protein